MTSLRKFNLPIILNSSVLLVMIVVLLFIFVGCSPTKPSIQDTTVTSTSVINDTVYAPGSVTVKIDKEEQKDSVIVVVPIKQIVDTIISGKPIRIEVPTLSYNVHKRISVSTTYATATATYNNGTMNIYLLQKESYIKYVEDSLKQIIYKSVNSNTLKIATSKPPDANNNIKYPKLVSLIDSLLTNFLIVLLIAFAAMLIFRFRKVLLNCLVSFIRHIKSWIK